MTEKFENASCVVEMKNEPACKVSISLMIKPAKTQELYKKATKSVNKQISIPGFRKGKAPDATVISRYSSYIEQEWKELLVQEGVHEAFELTCTYPVKKELLEKPKILSCEQQSGAQIVFSYERYPLVPEIDFRQIQLSPIEAKAISKEQIDEVLLSVRKAHANYEAVDKAIELGDFAEVTIMNCQNHTPLAEKRRLCVSEEQVVPWLFRLLIGMKSEETKEGETEGASILPVSVTVHAVLQSQLPSVDDELAKKVGASSVDDLMNKIKSNLEKEAENEKQHKQMEELESALLEKYPFDLPGSLIDQEKQIRLQRQLEDLKHVEGEEISHERKQQLEMEITEKSERGLRLYFLNRQIVKQGSLELTQEEINKELVQQMMLNPRLFNQNMDKETSERLISQASASLMERKIKDYALAAVLTN